MVQHWLSLRPLAKPEASPSVSALKMLTFVLAFLGRFSTISGRFLLRPLKRIIHFINSRKLFSLTVSYNMVDATETLEAEEPQGPVVYEGI